MRRIRCIEQLVKEGLIPSTTDIATLSEIATIVPEATEELHTALEAIPRNSVSFASLHAMVPERRAHEECTRRLTDLQSRLERAKEVCSPSNYRTVFL